jgi:hypothetical protein
MSRKIRTYQELLQEEQRLKAQLQTTQGLIKEDIAGIKEGMIPFRNVINTVRKFTTRDHKGTLVNFGLDFGIDLLVRRMLLARAGWFAKVAIPYVIKNYSSHIISDEKRKQIISKAQELFTKIRHKVEKTVKKTTA